MQDTSASAPSSFEVLSLNEFIRVLKHHWLVIFTIFSLCVAGVAVWTGLFTDKWYVAKAQIRVERTQGEVSLLTMGRAPVDSVFLQDQFKIIQSRKILEPMVERMGFAPRIAEMMGAPRDMSVDMACAILANRMLSVSTIPRTSIIDLAVWSKEPQLAADVANALAEEYERNRIEFATSNQTEGIRKLREELDEQAELVSRKRDEVERLRKDLNLAGVDLNLRGDSIATESLRSMERTLTALRVEMIARKTRWEQFTAVPPDQRVNLVNSELIRDANIQGLLRSYMDQQQMFLRLRGQLGEAHPEYIAASDNMKLLQRQLLNLLDGYEKSLEISYLEAQARADELERQLVEMRDQHITRAGGELRMFEEAARDLQEEETVLRTMRLSLRQREIDFQAPKRTIEILSEARPPVRASRPNWILNLALGVFAGLVLGVCCAYIIEFLDTSFRSIDDMERRLGLPILGVVSRHLILVGPSNYSHFEAEPYRVIQTNLEMSGADGSKVLVVQSAGPSEGKSTTLRNLAACLALADRKVLVIDTDLRRSSQHRLFKMDRAPGLNEYFSGEVTLEEIVRPTEVDGVYVITAGEPRPRSLTILHGTQLRDILVKLRDQFDRIFLDSPPIIGISDASVLASMAEGVLFVVQHGRNPQAMTQRAKHIINQVGGRIIGVVLNQVPRMGGEDYSYYTSNYYYYHSKDTSEPRKSASSSSGKKSERGTERIEISEA